VAKQVAALPIRRDPTGNLEVMLITSRETRRWVIPKGWPWPDREDHQAAAEEALEEAGVTGRASRKSLGTYSYYKRKSDVEIAVCVSVYLLRVTNELDTWRERKQRKRTWVPIDQAATMVLEPGLSRLMRRLANRTGAKARQSTRSGIAGNSIG